MTAGIKQIHSQVFVGGMNSDIAQEVMPNDTARYILNCNVLSSSEGNVGVVTNIKGTVQIDFELPEGENKTIGYASDEENNKFYFAVWNSEGYHTWYRYSSIDNSVDVVIQSITDTGGDEIFAWDRNNLILHANIIQNNLLYWTQKNQPARKINIDKCMDKSSTGYGDVISEEDTRAYKRPPMLQPSVSYITDTGRKFNRVYGLLFKFVYRFIYDDGEASNWSDFSKVPVPPEESYTGVKGVPLENNGIIVTLLTGSNMVVKIEIGMQKTNPDGIGSDELGWSLIATLDKSVLGIGSNGQYDYEFFNDSSYTSLDINKVLRPYSFLPKNPSCQEFTKNALLYSAFYEGFPEVEIDMAASVRYDQLFLPSGSVSELNNPQIIYNFIDNIYEGGGLFSNGWRHTVGEIVIGPDVKAGNRFYVYFSDGNKSFSYNIKATLSDEADTIATSLSTVFKTNAQMNGGGGYVEPVIKSGGFARFRFRIWNNAGLPYWNITTSVNRVNTVSLKDNGQSVNNIKLGSSNGYGIMYEDFDGRKSLVYSNDTVVNISTINELNGIRRPVVSLNIKNEAPEWASYYQIVRTGDLVYDDYIQILIQKIVVYTDAGGNSFYDLVVGSLYTYQQIYPNATIGFPFEKGDRVRLISQYNGTTWGIVGNVKEYEVIEYNETTTEVVNQDIEVNGTIEVKVSNPSLNNIGSFIVIAGHEREIVDIIPSGYRLSSIISTGDTSSTKKYPSFEIVNKRGVIRVKVDPAYPIVVDPKTNKFALVEVYKPSVSKSELSDENYYSFGYKFPIERDGDNYYHVGNIQNQTSSQDAIVEIAEGNNYVRSRLLPTNTSYKNPQYLVTTIEDPSYSDFYISDLSSNGRVNVLDKGYGEIYFDSRIRWSNNYIEGTRINGLNDFDNLDREDYNDKYGGIERIMYSEDRLYVFKHLKTCWVPIYGNVIQDAEGNPILTANQRIIPNKLTYFLWDGGVGDNPESVVRKGNHIFFISPNSGIIARIGGSGVVPLSSTYNLDSDSRQLINSIKRSGAKITGSFDSKNDNAEFYFEVHSDVVYNEEFSNSGWEFFYNVLTEDPIEITIVTPPEHGSITIDDDVILYTPDTGYIGDDYFLYSVSQGGVEIGTHPACIDVVAVERLTEWRPISPFCVLVSGAQTGELGFAELEEYYVDDDEPTGIVVDNVPTNNNYVPPITDTDTCPIHEPPIVDAGPDIMAFNPPGTTTLTAVVTETDAPIDTYLWELISGDESVVIDSPTTISTGISGMEEGEYVFRITVTDTVGAFASDEVMVTVSYAGLRVYYGTSEVNTLPSEVDVLNSPSFDIATGEDFIIPFPQSATPVYYWFAYAITEPIKTAWEDTVLPINKGEIGTSGSLFRPYVAIGDTLRGTITQYKTQFDNDIKISNG